MGACSFTPHVEFVVSAETTLSKVVRTVISASLVDATFLNYPSSYPLKEEGAQASVFSPVLLRSFGESCSRAS
jgi:hypothetical protein